MSSHFLWIFNWGHKVKASGCLIVCSCTWINSEGVSFSLGEKTCGIFNKKRDGSKLSCSPVCVAGHEDTEKIVPDSNWDWCNLGTNRQTEKSQFRVHFPMHFTYTLSLVLFKPMLHSTVRWNWNSFGKLPLWLWRKHIIHTSLASKYIKYMLILKNITQHVLTKALHKTEHEFHLQIHIFYFLVCALRHPSFSFLLCLVAWFGFILFYTTIEL